MHNIDLILTLTGGFVAAVTLGYLRELGELREAGADKVFSGEGEVALAMTEFILRSLGATPEQIDRERTRVHDKLFVPGPPSAVGAAKDGY